MNNTLLSITNLTKTFPGVKALDSVQFSLKAGSVHAVCGENGAGKSTLMNILMGIHQRDEGEILLRGEPVNFLTPRHALRAGISIIEQELNPVKDMTVA
ncbi:MAG: ATP-binding cassette domain-containing protein, partial [Sphaerochaetaceae bacterium]